MTFRTETSISSGDIRETTFAANYTALEMHQSLQVTAAELTAAGDDDLDLGDADPSGQEAFGKIITLNSPFNIDDSLTENLYDGTVIQDGGDTIYGALKVIGSVASTTQLEIDQNGSFLTNHWGNGKNTASGILNRILVKYRTGGADIDSRNIRVIARNASDTLAVFPITMEIGETTAAINTLTDSAWSNSNSGDPLALATTADLDILYDMAKIWKTLSLTNFDYPSAATLVAAKVGLQLQFSGVNVDIDSGAASTFAINTGTNKVTVKVATLAAGTKMTSISCDSNTMTLLNSAVISAGVDIATGCTVIIPTPSALTGTLTMTGGDLEIQGHSAGILSGTLDASSSIEISGATAADEFNMTGMVFDAASVIENTSGAAIVVKLLPAQTLPTKTETSGTITFSTAVDVPVTWAALPDGARVQLYDLDGSSELDNSLVSGGSGYSFTYGYAGDVNVQVTATYANGVAAKYPIIETGLITSSGLTIIKSMVDHVEYNRIGVDGSTVTELTADYADIEIDVDDSDNTFDSRRGVSWWVYICTTEAGIRNYNPEALRFEPDEYNVVVDGGLQIENVKAARLKITNGIWKRSDGNDIVAATSNTIHWVPDDRVYVAETGVSGLTTAESTKLLTGLTTSDTVDGIAILDALKAILAANAGKTSGMENNAPVFRNQADDADVITAATDQYGNRSSVVLNL